MTKDIAGSQRWRFSPQNGLCPGLCWVRFQLLQQLSPLPGSSWTKQSRCSLPCLWPSPREAPFLVSREHLNISLQHEEPQVGLPQEVHPPHSPKEVTKPSLTKPAQLLALFYPSSPPPCPEPLLLPNGAPATVSLQEKQNSLCLLMCNPSISPGALLTAPVEPDVHKHKTGTRHHGRICGYQPWLQQQHSAEIRGSAGSINTPVSKRWHSKSSCSLGKHGTPGLFDEHNPCSAAGAHEGNQCPIRES